VGLGQITRQWDDLPTDCAQTDYALAHTPQAASQGVPLSGSFDHLFPRQLFSYITWTKHHATARAFKELFQPPTDNEFTFDNALHLDKKPSIRRAYDPMFGFVSHPVYASKLRGCLASVRRNLCRNFSRKPERYLI
jgi:hypothetical protein